MSKPARPVPERMDAVTVIDPTGCWLWTGPLNNWGYGLLSTGSGKAGTQSRRMAHRVSYERHVGEIPAGLQLDHLCRVRNCINPAHLEPVTARENTLRSASVTASNARKTHCLRGHPLSGDNLGKQAAGRFCRACKRDGAA